MPTFHKDQPIRLDEHRFTSLEVCHLSGAPESALRNWVARATLPVGERFAGRLVFSLLDAIRLAAMVDLTMRVTMPPAMAAKVAELLVRQVVQYTPDGIADMNAVPRNLALVVAIVDGEPCVSLIDPTAPGYGEWPGQWGQAHVVLPVAMLVAEVVFRAFPVLVEHVAAGAP